MAPYRSIAHEITNFDICIKEESFSIADSVYRGIPRVNTSTSQLGYVLVEVDQTNITIYSGQNRNTWHVYTTIYYIKTID